MLYSKENCFRSVILLSNRESLEWFIITIIALEQFGLVFPIIGVDFYQHSIFPSFM